MKSGSGRRWDPEPPRGTKPEKLAVTLERFLAQMGAPPTKTLTTLESLWPTIVGPGLADRTRPIEVLDGVLVVGCEDSNWASQIGWMDAQIKERFAATFEGTKIRRIQLRIDS